MDWAEWVPVCWCGGRRFPISRCLPFRVLDFSPQEPQQTIRIFEHATAQGFNLKIFCMRRKGWCDIGLL
jgi:hypothetical protein